MQTLVIDTSTIVKKLEQPGFSRTQAEGVADALKEIDASALATKTDLHIALAQQTTSIVKWVSAVLLAQAALIVALMQYLK